MRVTHTHPHYSIYSILGLERYLVEISRSFRRSVTVFVPTVLSCPFCFFAILTHADDDLIPPLKRGRIKGNNHMFLPRAITLIAHKPPHILTAFGLFIVFLAFRNDALNRCEGFLKSWLFKPVFQHPSRFCRDVFDGVNRDTN